MLIFIPIGDEDKIKEAYEKWGKAIYGINRNDKSIVLYEKDKSF